jgi:hypothetical protein
VLFDLLFGTVQGLILGPVLYAIFVSPIWYITYMSAFADDTFIPKANAPLPLFIKDMEKTLAAITKWFKKLELIVNQRNTEACLFHNLTMLL